MTTNEQLVGRMLDFTSKFARNFLARTRGAQDRFSQRLGEAFEQHVAQGITGSPASPWEAWVQGAQYWVDFNQRTALFWDTLRRRGNNYLEHERAGKPPVLHFAYELVLDARKFARPVNYALARILPPAGVTVDPKRRPYIILDPRAGHGPGIGGFKDDSQVGVALRGGHPVYFIVFFPQPEPGQTLPDVTAAQHEFVHKVRELHPHSPKPVLVGNCQGGWAAMMLAASAPEDTGPVVINGAPMSYWGGAGHAGPGDNPMRYAGGLLGGTWLASLCADMGNGLFDGAWLVKNFEDLDPANACWDKYHHLFANIDTEPPRFLEFERWWGGYFLMNREEIEWITRNLFIGNKLWSGEVRSQEGEAFDLRKIQSPIVLFASLGDNITPPQQAFNWVADVYGSTEEIKARGQVIVGLLHKDIGHLGIFVSGRVAKKEHAQLVSVLESIEALPPGLYGMEILENKGKNGAVKYEVQFVEHDMKEVGARLNRFARRDEKPFQAVEFVSEFNQRAYELFARPLIQALANPASAKLLRVFHPLRVQHWALSDLNLGLAWTAPAALAARNQRRALAPEAWPRRLEQWVSEYLSASLDLYRDLRDASAETLFFQTYASLFSIYLAKPAESGRTQLQTPVPQPGLPFIKAALSSMTEGGYPEAVARVAALIERRGVPLSLSKLELREEMVRKFAKLLPDTTREQQRRIRGEQEIIVHYEPEKALRTLPHLLPHRRDRRRLVTLIDRILVDKRIWRMQPTLEQLAMLERIRNLLVKPARPRVRGSQHRRIHYGILEQYPVRRNPHRRLGHRLAPVEHN